MEDIENENRTKAKLCRIDVLEEEKELVLFCWKLGELEVEKAIRFHPTNISDNYQAKRLMMKMRMRMRLNKR